MDDFDTLLVKLVGSAATDDVEGVADACAQLRRLYRFTTEDFNRAYNAGMRAAQEASEAQLNALFREGTVFRCVNCGTLYDIRK